MPDRSLFPGVLPLDYLEALVIVDNETDTLSSVDAGVPQIPELVHLAARTPATRFPGGREGKVVFDRLCCACHGLSVLLTGRRGHEERRLLFDVGPYSTVWRDNAKRLDLDLATIDTVVLSHWHFDHSGGFPAAIAAISAARAARGLPPPSVDLHPDRPEQRGVLAPSGMLILLPEEPDVDAMARAGGVIVQHADPHPACDGFFFVSGAIDRTTEYETGLVGHHSLRHGVPEPDPLIMDERFAAAFVAGRGLTVLSACSHAGIVNTCLQAQKHFPGTPIDVVMGGYHLAGSGMESRIEDTVSDLARLIVPRVVAPGHCTGWRAKVRLANVFAPGRYAPSVVGSLFRLESS